MRGVGVAASVIIVAGYLWACVTLPGVLLSFRAPSMPRYLLLGIQVGGGTFFATCAATHIGQAAHLIRGGPVGADLDGWFHVTNMTIQAVAIWVFLVALRIYLTDLREQMRRRGVR